ncbi:hypothetical protein C8J57DRAFT_1611234 [Mycena rebaudengoi]|nr:hypothetical protein C8J57DRAFT_1611234 [Mycena rebaudengoi]
MNSRLFLSTYGTPFQIVCVRVTGIPVTTSELINWPFALAALAEAAEKYQVYSAMNICHLRMKEFLPAHAAEILSYAARHDYPFLVAEVAPLLIDMSLVDVVTILLPHILLPWIKYREEWVKVLNRAKITLQDHFSYDRYPKTPCLKCAPHRRELLTLSIQLLLHFETVFAQKLDSHCATFRDKWKAQVSMEVSSIPKFTTFL